MALPSAVVEQSTSKLLSAISTKLGEKASRAETLSRIEIAVRKLDFIIEKTGKRAITDISLIRSWNVLKRIYKEGMDLLNKKYKPQLELDGQVVVRSSSYFHRFAKRAANLSSYFLNKQLSPYNAEYFERYVNFAEKFVADVESSCPLRHDRFRYPFLKHLFEEKAVWCQIGNKRSKSLSLYLCPLVVEGRGVEVTLRYEYEDCRKLTEGFFGVIVNIRISEDTDIIGICIECMQWLVSRFDLDIESPVGELTLLQNLHDTFHVSVPPPSFLKHWFMGCYKEYFRPDPVCCIGNSCGAHANKSLEEIPEPVNELYFWCSPSAHKNKLSNASLLILDGLFEPHAPSHGCSDGVIDIKYGGKEETKNGGSVKQLKEIARSDGLYYLVHEPEPTDYALFWFSPHGCALVTLRQAVPCAVRKVSKRKR